MSGVIPTLPWHWGKLFSLLKPETKMGGFYDFLTKWYLANLSCRGTGILLYMEAHSIFEVSMKYLLIIGWKEDFRENNPGMMGESPKKHTHVFFWKLFGLLSLPQLCLEPLFHFDMKSCRIFNRQVTPQLLFNFKLDKADMRAFRRTSKTLF